MSTVINLDGKTYFLSERRYRGTEGPHRTVGLGLTGKVIVQDFTPMRQEKWDITILCFRQTNRPGFGTVDDLRTAWGKQSIEFIDIDGNTHDVVIENEFNFEPDHTIPVPDHLFRVKIVLQNLFAEEE